MCKLKKARFLRNNKVKDNITAYAFLSPAIVLYTLFIGGPVIATVVLSLFKYNLLVSPQFVGLQNFKILFSDPLTWQVIGNTMLFTAVLVPIHVIIGLLLASLVSHERNPFLKYIYRTSVYFPSILTTASVAVAWYYMFNYDYGVFNWILKSIGLESIPWLTSPRWVVLTISLFSLWKFVGTPFLYYLIGLQNIPSGYYDAAKIDGANGIQTFFRITLPLLSPTMFFVITITIINTFQIFDEPYIITHGGPGNATKTLALYIYEKSFKSYEMGFSSAVAFCLFIIVFIFTAIQLALQKKWVTYDYE
ncbi:MAG: sugar ABC transporter permease [Clostridiaceae bacterium]|nr:sugar ABC transporter permease [Clostridiaceae bacterium]